MGKTLFDKIWDDHAIRLLPDGKTLLHVDRHILHDLTAPQAFASLQAAGRKLRNPELTAATEDHVVATTPLYQSLGEVARSIGCEVSAWRPDLADDETRRGPSSSRPTAPGPGRRGCGISI